MNAFHRGHAVTALEELALIIAIHCVLVSSYPNSSARQHWEAELDGFRKTLRRLNRGKKGKQNFTLDLLTEVISDHVKDIEERETIEAHIVGKDLDIDAIDWNAAEARVNAFCADVLSNP
jgi:hypothetical protein